MLRSSGRGKITMLDVAHGIMFVGTCLCIISFCAGFSLGRDYQERREYETITEEKAKVIINELVNEAVAQALKNFDTVKGGIS